MEKYELEYRKNVEFINSLVAFLNQQNSTESNKSSAFENWIYN